MNDYILMFGRTGPLTKMKLFSFKCVILEICTSETREFVGNKINGGTEEKTKYPNRSYCFK